MRDNVRAFVQAAAEAFGMAEVEGRPRGFIDDGPIYEFGSYLVDDQQELADLRPIFSGREYIGCDMRSGPGVDRVEDLASLSLPDHCARGIVCVDTLEHVFDVMQAMRQMWRVLAPGGIMLVSVPMDFRIHAYPDDYWRLTPSCLARLFAPAAASVIGSQGVESHPHTAFAIAAKGPVEIDFAAGAREFVDSFNAWLEHDRADAPFRTRFKRRISFFRGKGERRRQRDSHTARFAVSLPVQEPFPQPMGMSSGLGGRLDVWE
ncbi:MAG: class I SAM-dependent methyltransferase [Pirellulales bacterium]|nr:class I SAM-dependent methyltransferase [Pirellulales bacterium]